MQEPLSLAAAAGNSARAATHSAVPRRPVIDVEAGVTGCTAASAPTGAGGCTLIPAVGAFAGQYVTARRHDLSRCSASQGASRASVMLGHQCGLPADRAGPMGVLPASVRARLHAAALRQPSDDRRPPTQPSVTGLARQPGQLIRHLSPRRLANYPCPGIHRVVVRRQFTLPAVNGQGCRASGQGSELLTTGIGQGDGQGSVSSVASTCC